MCRSGPQEGQDREYPAIAARVRVQPEFGEDGADDGFNGLDAQVQFLADRGVGEAAGHKLEHLSFAGAQSVEVASLPLARSSSRR
jgi:hypothetical protein